MKTVATPVCETCRKAMKVGFSHCFMLNWISVDLNTPVCVVTLVIFFPHSNIKRWDHRN